MIGFGNVRRQQTHRQPTTTTAGSYSRPSYFGRDTTDGYRLISQERSKSRTKQYPNHDLGRSKSIEKGASTTIQISSTEIMRMRKDLQQLEQSTNGLGYYHSEVEFSKKAAKQLPNQTDRTPTSHTNQLANVSPIYTKKRHYDKEVNFNNKLDLLIKRLEEVRLSEYLSPAVDTTYVERRNIMNTSLKQQRHSSRSVHSKKQLENSYNEAVSFNLSKKQAKSIFLMSDVSHESSRVGGLLDASGRTNQTSQRLNVPTSRETNKAGTSSIQYHMLQEKIQRRSEDLQFEKLFDLKPHRSRITSMVQNLTTSEIYTTSLDYSVAVVKPDEKPQDRHWTLYKHRGGVECSLLLEDLLITGGRDCYLRSNQDWSKRFEATPMQLLRLRGDRLAVKTVTGSFYEFDVNTLELDEKCCLEPQSFLLQSEHIPNGCLIGNKSSLSLYDSRKGRPQQLLSLNDNITCWKLHRDKIIAVGKHLWIGSHNRMEKLHTLPEGIQVDSIVEYYSSYLLSSRSCQNVLLYESDLNIMGKVQHAQHQLSLFSLKNRLVCGHPNGTMDLCILK